MTRFFATLFLSLSLTMPVVAQSFDRITSPELASIFAELGLETSEQTRQDGVQSIILRDENFGFFINLRDCNEEATCAILQYGAIFDFPEPITIGQVNSFYQRIVIGRVLPLSDTRIVLQHAVPLRGGVTEDYIVQSYQIWQSLMVAFNNGFAQQQ